MERKKAYKPYMIALVIAMTLELVLFNFRSWQSLFYDPVEYPLNTIGGEEINVYEGGVLELTEGSGIYLTQLDELAGTQIHNVFLDIELLDAEELPYAESGVLTLSPKMTDAGNSMGVTLADRKMRNDDGQSHYLWFAGAGQIKELSFGLSLSNGTFIRINKVVINKRQPLHISWGRLLVCCILAMAAAGLRKGSLLWKNESGITCSAQAVIAVVTGAVLILPFAILIFSNDYLTGYVRFQPYHELTKAICDGRVYLDSEPPQWMKELENPYDETLRDYWSNETGEGYLWDYVYHNGRYYVYYGIVPCILLYLPFYLLTGTMLPNSLVVMLAAVCLYAGAYLFCRKVSERVGGIPFAVVIMLTVATFMGCQMPFFLNQPDAYAVPVVWGEAFLTWGLYLWCCVEDTGKRGILCLAAGSLCMALTVGCRPNMAVYIFLCIPLFWNIIKGWKAYWKEDKKRFIEVLAAFGLPFVPVAIGLMIYNALRFGSPFDFGYAYNLTVHDSVHVPFSLDKIWLGIYEYLLRVPELGYSFPFMTIGGAEGVEYNALGHTVTYMEYIFGGLLPCCPVLLFLPALLGREKKEKHLLGRMALVCVIISVFLMLLDTEMGGVVYRYMADFSLTMLMAAAVAVMLAYKDMGTDNARGVMQGVLLLCLLVTLVFHVNFYWLSGLKYPLIWGNTSLYYKIYRAFVFW